MRESHKGGPILPLLVFCLQGMAWSLGLSKAKVQETEILGRPDTVFLKNPSNASIRVHTLRLKLSGTSYSNWEFSLKANRAPTEVCFGKGEGLCPPASPESSVKPGWVVPPGDSLVLSDFNLAECLRCPLSGPRPGSPSGSAAALEVPLLLRSGNTEDTLVVRAGLGEAAWRPLPAVPAVPASPSRRGQEGGR